MLLSTPRPQIPFFLVIPTTILLVAYLYSLITRPELDPHAKVDDPHRFGWPAWYTQGGKTPYDVLSGDGGEVCDERMSVLLFIDLPYNSTSVPYALEVIRTLRSDSNVHLSVISPFSPNWDSARTIKENLESAGCGDRFWRIGENVRDLEGACLESALISEILPVDGGEASASNMNFHSDPRANISIVSQPHDLVSPHASHAELSSQHGEGWEMGLFSHVLPSANPSIYYPSRSYMSRRSVTYFPHPLTPTSRYPALPWGRTWSIYHPKSHSPPRKEGEDILDEKSAYSTYWRKEDARQADVMRRAGICIFEGWEKGILDERVVQAMLSGCVVAMVPPDVEHEALRPLLIPLSRPTLDSGLPVPLPVDVLQPLLKVLTTSSLKKKALDAFILARQRFLPNLRARAVFDAAKKWEKGGRGYLFPNGWRWSCNGSGERPPWCE